MSFHRRLGDLHHVAIHVNDLARARDFYEGVLGLSPAETPPAAAERGILWYDLPDGRQIHLSPPDGELSMNRAHFALTVDDVRGWRSFLDSKGVEIITPRVELYNAERIFFRDPFGNLIEFVKWLP